MLEKCLFMTSIAINKYFISILLKAELEQPEIPLRNDFTIWVTLVKTMNHRKTG